MMTKSSANGSAAAFIGAAAAALFALVLVLATHAWGMP